MYLYGTMWGLYKILWHSETHTLALDEVKLRAKCLKTNRNQSTYKSKYFLKLEIKTNIFHLPKNLCHSAGHVILLFKVKNYVLRKIRIQNKKFHNIFFGNLVNHSNIQPLKFGVWNVWPYCDFFCLILPWIYILYM